MKTNPIPKPVNVAILSAILFFFNLTTATAIEQKVILTEGTNFAVNASPDRSQFVFDLQGTLWLVPASGGTAKPLTDARDDARLPQWSPDGKQIAYQSYREDHWQIWTIKPNGTAAHQLTWGNHDHREPTWSADGNSLFFSSDRSGNYDIWSLGIQSDDKEESLHQISTTTDDEYSPAISADGQLAYLVKEPGWGGQTLIRIHQGESYRNVFSESRYKLNGLAWRPDGKAVSFVSYDDIWNATQTKLLELNIDTNEIRELSPPDADVFPFPASWLKVDELVYTQNGRINRLDLNNGKREAITFTAEVSINRHDWQAKQHGFDDPASRPLKGIFSPVISPDGQHVAFSALGDIWILPINPNGTSANPKRITLAGSLEIHPSFSANGKQLAYASDRAGNMDIWLYHFDSKRHERITYLEGDESMPNWSPASPAISFLKSGRKSTWDKQSIAVLELDSGKILDVATGLFSPGRPAWSPDGKLLAVSVLEPASGRFREGRNVIRIINIESGENHVMTLDGDAIPGSRVGAGPAWSKDPSRMIYINAGNLWAINVDTMGQAKGQPWALNQAFSSNPSSSANGDMIVYQVDAKLQLLNTNNGRTRTLPVVSTWSVPAYSEPLLIRAGRVFDAVNENYRENIDILVAENRIKAIAPRGEIPFKGKIIDASDRVVMPGLIESHSHQSARFGQALGRLWLSYGITSVREPGADPYDALQRKETWASGTEPGPRQFFTGPLMDGTRIYYAQGSPIASNQILQQELERALALDYDMIKTYVRLPDRTQQQLVKMAHSNGLPVASHYLYPAVSYGADAVEHMGGTNRFGFSKKQSLRNNAYQDVISLISATGMSLTPTLSLQVGMAVLTRQQPDILSDLRYLAFYTEAERADFQKSFLKAYFGRWENKQLESALERHRTELKNIVSAGGHITAGSDSPFVPYGLSLHTELMSSVGENGLTTRQALLSATAWAADAMHVGDQIGRIAEGMLADMIIIDGDPLEHIEDTLKLEAVISAGRYFPLETVLQNP